MRQEYKSISKNIVYTYCDFTNDIFAKKLFDQLDMPIYDIHLPSLILFDFIQLNPNDLLSGEIAKAYHFPALDPHEPVSQNIVITNPKIITNFVFDFFKGKLHPTLPNEDI